MKISDDDLPVFKSIIQEIADEYNVLWQGADVHFNDDQVILLRKIAIELGIKPSDADDLRILE